jgi:hypothetical protein
MQFSSIVYDLLSQMQARFLQLLAPRATRSGGAARKGLSEFPYGCKATGTLEPIFCARGILSVADKSLRRDIFAPLPGV